MRAAIFLDIEQGQDVASENSVQIEPGPTLFIFMSKLMARCHPSISLLTQDTTTWVSGQMR